MDTKSSDLIGQRHFRIEKIAQLRQLGIDPYPSRASRTTNTNEPLADYSQFENKSVTVAGRLMSWREHGQLYFGHVQDMSGKIQLYIKNDVLNATSKENQTIGFEDLNLLDIGDLVEAEGIVTKTNSGEISILVKNLKILAKALRPLPDKREGIKDRELLFRQRYLDMIVSPEKRWRFEKAAQITFAIRQFLNSKGFLEIKTPILQPLYGGGTAKPFKSHVNALDVDFYMAISHELYLKRLITAGFENVYNITGYFRNEGIDRTHNPEFQMLETMTAFKNYEYNMDLSEQMYKYIAETVFDKTVFKIGEHEIDFSKEWPRIKMIDAVRQYAGYDFEKISSLEEAHKILDELGIREKTNSIGEVMVQVFEEKVEEQLIQPTFIYGHPVEISPLAKKMPDDPRFVERFEIFIGGIEGGDNWTELNDPLELYERFKDQVARKRGGNEESHPMDVDFLETIEYGMPPTTGLGPGIERLTMMLTDTQYIDDVLFFPMLRPAPVTEIQKKIYGQEYVTNVSGKITSKEQDFGQKMVIVVRNDLAPWQITNAVGHVSAYLGHNLADNFDTGKSFVTADGKEHPRNSQYPIVALSAKPGQMTNLMSAVRDSGLLYHGFIREMIETSNDEEIVNILSMKNDSEMEYYAIGIFGNNEKVDALTKKFSLFK